MSSLAATYKEIFKNERTITPSEWSATANAGYLAVGRNLWDFHPDNVIFSVSAPWDGKSG
jgi:hypothetical protein